MDLTQRFEKIIIDHLFSRRTMTLTSRNRRQRMVTMPRTVTMTRRLRRRRTSEMRRRT